MTQARAALTSPHVQFVASDMARYPRRDVEFPVDPRTVKASLTLPRSRHGLTPAKVTTTLTRPNVKNSLTFTTRQVYPDSMTETPPAPTVLSPRDEARVSLAFVAEKLGELAYALMPVRPDAPRGERLRQALALKDDLDNVISRAVIVEREEGTTWAQLADAAGISKQAAHERWAGAVSAWAANGRTALNGSFPTLDAVARLDKVYARLHPDHPDDAVSSGLDAVRFPGAEAAENARRARAAALHERLNTLGGRINELATEFRTLTDTSAPASVRAEVLRAQAALQEEAAALYEELTGAEPELADEHRARSERCRGDAAGDREYADLLASRDQTATEEPA